MYHRKGQEIELWSTIYMVITFKLNNFFKKNSKITPQILNLFLSSYVYSQLFAKIGHERLFSAHLWCDRAALLCEYLRFKYEILKHLQNRLLNSYLTPTNYRFKKLKLKYHKSFFYLCVYHLSAKIRLHFSM